MTYNFRTGIWKKANPSARDHMNFLMNNTNAQRSFVHEVAHQMLGNPPSKLWGVPVPHELRPSTDRNTLAFVRAAAKQPSHEFGRLISEHKRGAGFVSALGELISGGAKVVGKYGKNVASFIGKHGAAIGKGISITKDLVQTGTAVGQLAGLIHPETKSKIDQIADAIYKHAQLNTPGQKKGGRVLV